ncbi:hypothetical protein HYN46_02030 [Aquirhabdus parva]|uniref:Fe2OG dioxygenase domain-containing protein n=1 Tax=Aquirhabdus parva TaxID=2283318 RepID=A0A345PB04_9GAMM|nr:hypothetical protein HYN46_02030 [Aquirhabdus parva]
MFNSTECEQFIERSHQFAYEAALINTGYKQSELRLDVRNNQRVIYDSFELADELFERLRPLLPASLNGWDLAGLNERFRFYLYENGQTFKPHYDASFEKNDWLSSQLSLLIYLNDEFEGGETIFYRESGMLRPCKETQLALIKPTQGQVLIFEHQQLHEGAPVLSGRKYVLRTDVMYSYKCA